MVSLWLHNIYNLLLLVVSTCLWCNTHCMEPAKYVTSNALYPHVRTLDVRHLVHRECMQVHHRSMQCNAYTTQPTLPSWSEGGGGESRMCGATFPPKCLVNQRKVCFSLFTFFLIWEVFEERANKIRCFPNISYKVDHPPHSFCHSLMPKVFMTAQEKCCFLP